MIIAKNNEAMRSKIWRIVMTVSSILIILIAIFLLTKMFTSNPLEGKWVDEDGNYVLNIKSNGNMVVTIPEIAEGTSVDVPMGYSLDKEEKTIHIIPDEEELEELAGQSEDLYTVETLENALGMVSTTFDYSVDRDQLTLTEREYGEQMVFTKE